MDFNFDFFRSKNNNSSSRYKKVLSFIPSNFFINKGEKIQQHPCNWTSHTLSLLFTSFFSPFINFFLNLLYVKSKCRKFKNNRNLIFRIYIYSDVIEGRLWLPRCPEESLQEFQKMRLWTHRREPRLDCRWKSRCHLKEGHCHHSGTWISEFS